MLEQLGLAGPQPECDLDVSTEDCDEPAGASLPQVANSTDVSEAPELGPTGVQGFKNKVDELARRLPLPVDPEISWDALTDSDDDETVTDDSGADFESPDPGGRAVAAEVDTSSALSPAMQGRLAGKRTGWFLSLHGEREVSALTGQNGDTAAPGLAGRLAGKGSDSDGMQEYVIDRVLLTDGGSKRFVL
jgi:hypothetical protein